MGRKHFEKEEKLLVTSNFSFSHSVFKRLVLQTRKNRGLFGKGITALTTHPRPGWATIALGFSKFSHIRTLRWFPSRSDTSILDVPESVQNRMLCIQSTATPPE